MKKINRFYLVIAGLIASRTYPVMAFSGMECSKIISCCNLFPDSDDSDIKEATCCRPEYPSGTQFSQCWDVCLNKSGSAYCDGDINYCNSAVAQEQVNNCYNQLASGTFWFKDVWDDSLCNRWSAYDSDGGVSDDAYCMGDPNRLNIWNFCCGNDTDCIAVNTGAADFDALCGSGCEYGYYLSGQHCLKCPQYAAQWTGDSYTYNNAGSDASGSGVGIHTCYVPNNIQLSDNGGRYVYDARCYYGS